MARDKPKEVGLRKHVPEFHTRAGLFQLATLRERKKFVMMLEFTSQDERYTSIVINFLTNFSKMIFGDQVTAAGQVAKLYLHQCKTEPCIFSFSFFHFTYPLPSNCTMSLGNTNVCLNYIYQIQGTSFLLLYKKTGVYTANYNERFYLVFKLCGCGADSKY